MSIEKARTLAKIAHAGQKYGDADYFEGHVAKVVARVEADPEAAYGEITVAWLHDIVEDTNVTLDDLRDFGFSDEIVQSVDILTRRRGAEPYFSYIRFIANDRRETFAYRVKLHDLQENLANTKITGPASMIKRYEKSLDLMTS